MEPILFEIKGSVGYITLNRPSKYNSFTRELALGMQEALKTCRDDQAVRCILITGAGKAFCAGQDLGEITQENPPSLSTVLSEHLNPIIRLIREIEKPVLAAVNGVAAGAGANLAIACDITVAAPDVNFIQAFSKIGLIPDSGGTFFLPRLVGMQRAMAYMMLGDKISAQEAVSVGMIYQILTDEDFEAAALAFANRLAQMPTRALGLTKRALNQAWSNDLDRQLAVEEHLQGSASLTQDFQEGVTAFLEKRKPTFKGE